jgi:ATP-dependent RNA helicase HelY
VAVSLEALHVGDVFRIGSGRRSGWSVVVQPARSHKGEWTGPTVVTEDKHLHKVSLNDVPAPVEAVTRIKVPSHLNPKNPKSRRDLATSLRIALPQGEAPWRKGKGRDGEAGGAGGVSSAEAGTENAPDDRIDDLQRRLKAHPCHQCPEREDHARWAERWWRLKRETVGLQRKVEGRTNTVARSFDRICAALVDIGYLAPDGESVTPEGERLRRLYTEKDLLAALCLQEGVWKKLDAPGLAACVSTLIHEPRGEGTDVSPRMPTDQVSEAFTRMQQLWSDLEDLETRHGLPTTSAPDAGMAWSVHRWARGRDLDEVLRGQDMAAGDFVRRCKQIVDLLGQVADAADDAEMRRTARTAIDAVLRGVVVTI